MDYFKRIQQVNRKVGKGDWNCPCCLKESRVSKTKVRRYARRQFKQQMKDITQEKHRNWLSLEHELGSFYEEVDF